MFRRLRRWLWGVQIKRDLRRMVAVPLRSDRNAGPYRTPGEVCAEAVPSDLAVRLTPAMYESLVHFGAQLYAMGLSEQQVQAEIGRAIRMALRAPPPAPVPIQE